MDTTEKQTPPNLPVRKDECKTNALLGLIALLVIISGVGWYLYFDIKSQKEQTLVQLNNVSNEKDEVSSQLNELLVQYDDMETNNDSLNAQLSAEKERIKQVLEELKKVKSSNRWQIHKYKKELFTLREIMKSYIYQIDSLNTLNIHLQKENRTITKQSNVIKSKNKQLEEMTETLSSTVEKASILRAINIATEALKTKGKPTRRGKKTDKIKVCFTIAENAVAPKGAQFIYLQITDPSGKILSGAQNIIKFGEQEIAYSDKREVDYNNQDLDICIYWKKDCELAKGDYKVALISNGNIIGTDVFYLK